MLKNLQIENLILIESAEVNFESGFNVITGETGAGKSLFLSALKLLSGHKAAPNIIRKGAEKARIEATFILDPEYHSKVYQALKEIDIESDEELIILREILPGGKSKARINGTLVNIKSLQILGQTLIQLHGQSEQVLLRDISTHGSLLDGLAPLEDLLNQYRLTWKTYSAHLKKIAALNEARKQNEVQQDFFKFQLNELIKADLKPNEEDELEAELKSLESAGEMNQLKDQSLEILVEGDQSLQFQLKHLIQTLEPFAKGQSVIQETLASLKEALPNIEEAGYSMRGLSIPESISPYEIDAKNSRLAQLQQLKRKFNLDIDGLIALREERQTQVSSVEEFDTLLADLEFEKKSSMDQLWKIAQELHQVRQATSSKLDKKVTQVLSHLGMGHAEFFTQLQFPDEFDETQLNPRGANTIEFQVRTNQGSEFQSLKKGISGGELSRVMLALKSALADNDQTPILLFDEVDSGISGEIGHSIGECMQSLGQYHQVLCITHLHQVAVQAKLQLTVSKSEVGNQTLTQISNLSEEQRVSEIARMLGGSQDQEWLKQSKRLLEQA